MQFSKTSPLKSGESSEKSSGENRVKSCHVCGCHGFFGPEQSPCVVWFILQKGNGFSDSMERKHINLNKSAKGLSRDWYRVPKVCLMLF